MSIAMFVIACITVAVVIGLIYVVVLDTNGHYVGTWIGWLTFALVLLVLTMCVLAIVNFALRL